MTTDDELEQLARQAGEGLLKAGLVAVTAESCTGGWIAKCLTDVAGSSAWFDRGYITYSNAAKMKMLDVPAEVINEHGAVSKATVRAMATGALAKSGAAVAVAVSGVAGPGGGTPDKPVGTVWLAWALRNDCKWVVRAKRVLLPGDREAVRRRSVAIALEALISLSPTDCQP